MADTTQDLKHFYQAVSEFGFSRDFQARIDLIKLNGFEFFIEGDKATDIAYLYIKEFSLPGVKKSVASVKYKGVDINAPSTRDFGSSKSWEVTFYVDTYLRIRSWLEDRLTESAANTPGSVNHIPNEKLDFAQVSVYDDLLKKVITYTIKGLFIKELPNQGYNVSGGGKIQEVKVVFGYQTWESEIQPYVASEDKYPGGKPGSNGVPDVKEVKPFQLFSINNLFS